MSPDRFKNEHDTIGAFFGSVRGLVITGVVVVAVLVSLVVSIVNG
ncbi:hypothetical protein [Microbacterium sp. 13-71-7]|jgi:hypothetical protein|nr:hypothetical protein [Microbacterium sp. 13-71-7]